MSVATAPYTRAMVILALEAQYPHQMTEASLLQHLRGAYGGLDAARALARDLAYIEELGLADSEVTKLGARRIISWRLTAAGVDVAEGSTTVPGITVEPGE